MLSQAADQVVTNQATLQDSNTFTVSMTSGVKYRIRGKIWFETTATGDFKFGFSQPTSSFLRSYVLALAAGASFPAEGPIATTLTTSTSLTATGGTGGFIEFDVLFYASSTASFKFQFAQNTQTNDAGAIVKAGSYLEWSVA